MMTKHYFQSDVTPYKDNIKWLHINLLIYDCLSKHLPHIVHTKFELHFIYTYTP